MLADEEVAMVKGGGGDGYNNLDLINTVPYKPIGASNLILSWLGLWNLDPFKRVPHLAWLARNLLYGDSGRHVW